MSPTAAKPTDPFESTLQLIRTKRCFSHKGSTRRQIFEFLVSIANEPAGESRVDVLRRKFWPERKLANDIGKRRSTRPGLDHDQNAKVRGAIRHVKQDLANFFSEGEGKDHPWAIQIADLTWELQLVPNRTRQESAESLRSFWEPHLRGQSTILYPTPPFFEDKKQTFLRNPHAEDETSAKRTFSYLNGTEFSAESLTPAYQWTPVGAAVSMVRIAQCLQGLGQQVDIASFRSYDEFNEHQNIVLIGLPSAFSLVKVFEMNLPVRTSIGQVSVGNKTETDDPTDGVYSTPSYEKVFKNAKSDWASGNPVLWGSVTRRGNIDPRFAVTVVAGSHNRVIQGIADFVCNGDQLLALARKFDPAATRLPEAFQARFRMEMHRASIGFKVSSIEVESVRIIDWRGSARPTKD